MEEPLRPDPAARPAGQKSGPRDAAAPPGGGSFLERPRVDSLLEKALENSVALVVAGEGYGKTSAVRAFLNRKRAQTGGARIGGAKTGEGSPAVVWIPLSERDNDPWHFWETFVNADGPYDDRVKKALEEIGFPESPGQINRCCQVLSKAVPAGKKHIVAIDDCHLVREKPILDFLKKLAASPFPRKTFVLISRTEPDINAVSLLSKGMLARIRADDLRFSEEEITGYFRLRKIPLAREEAKRIFADTEGWIQALNLIAAEMERSGEGYRRSLLERGSFRIMEEKLFSSLPAPLRRFLAVISLFDRWPLEVMEKIAEAAPDKPPPVKDLAVNMHQLSSLIQYDAYLHGFRIHRAFLDFLREKQKGIPGEEIKAACSIAAEWCRENNLFIDAAINYGMAGDYGGLLKTIHSFPGLMSPAMAAPLLGIVENALDRAGPNEEDGDFLFLSHVTRAGLLVNMGRYDEARAIYRESVSRYEARPPDPLNSLILSASYNSLGSLSLISYRQTRDLESILDYFKRGCRCYARHPYPVSGPGARASVGSYSNSIGRHPGAGEFEAFIDIVAQSIPYASRSIGGYLSGMDNLCRAELAFFKGDLPAAEQLARKAIFSAREKRQYEIESKGLFYLCRIFLCGGNISSGRETWEQMEAQLETDDYVNRYAIYDILAGWFYAHTGRTEKIAPWLKNELEESDLNLLFHNYETLIKAKFLFAEKKYAETLDLLETKEVREGLGSFHLGVLEIAALKAAAHNRMGNGTAAREILESAYMAARPDSLDMPFIELGEDMRALAGAALSAEQCAIPRPWLETMRNKASVYAKKLAVVLEQYERSGGAGTRGANGIPPLSPQEASILEGISRGFTREEIARNHSLPLNSVKCAIKAIYGKLGAFNRADAIRIAAGLGIFADKE